jgi:hypothetical protein
MLREVVGRGADWLGELDSAAEQGCARELTSLPDALAEQEFAALHQLTERLGAERLRRLHDLERRRIHERDGHLSAAS